MSALDSISVRSERRWLKRGDEIPTYSAISNYLRLVGFLLSERL